MPLSEQQVAQFVGILGAANRLNLGNPDDLNKAKKILSMAKDLQTNQKFQPLPDKLSIALLRFFDSVGARPEVAGIKTTVLGNKWERLFKMRSPLDVR